MVRDLFLLLCLATGLAGRSTPPAIRNLAAGHATEDSVVLAAQLQGSAFVTAYFGIRDGGCDRAKWDFEILVGERSSGVVEAPVEGLTAGATYYFTFLARGAEGSVWAEKPLTFTTQGALAIQGVDERTGAKHVPERGFINARPARNWPDALISGNGKMGAMVLGHPAEEKIILSHERLFVPWHPTLPPVNSTGLLPRIRQLLKDGRYQEAADAVYEQSLKEGYGAKRWTDPLIPAFDLLVHMQPRGAVKNYLRSLDYSTGVVTVRWEDARGVYRRRLFVSRADDVMVFSIQGPGPGTVDCDLELAGRPIDRYPGGVTAEEKLSLDIRRGSRDVFAYGIKDVQISAAAGWMSYRSSFRNGSGGYHGAAGIRLSGGTASVRGRQVSIRGADEVRVILRVEPLDRFEGTGIGGLQSELAAIPGDFEALLDRHRRIHGGIFNRVKLDLGGGADRQLPAEKLIAKSTVEAPSLALIEKAFDSGRYEILSSSGDLPPNLQGVWTGTWESRWSGDYTLNGNFQVAISSMLNGNMPECLDTALRYVESLAPAGRINAQRLYGTRGIHIPSRTSTHGFNNHFDRTHPMTFWTAGAGWLAHFFYDYYLYTGDRKFLVDRALPFMKEAALFYEDFLVADEHGKFVFSPSYSPENNPSNSKSQASINAAMDIGVARELFTSLIDADPENAGRWKRMLARMPDYLVNEDGAVKEWAWPGLNDNYGHRHLSHLYGLFHGLSPDIAASPQLMEAFRRAIELRMKERIKHNGGTMAFGLALLGESAISLRDRETSYQILRWLVNRYYYEGLASSHDVGPAIFNADLSGGFPDLVMRMLVQSNPGKISLLPVLPKEWASGSIEGVLARGQVTVKSLRWDPGKVNVVLNSTREQTVEVELAGEIRKVFLPANRDMQVAMVRKLPI